MKSSRSGVAAARSAAGLVCLPASHVRTNGWRRAAWSLVLAAAAALLAPLEASAMGRLLYLDEGYISRCKAESADGKFAGAVARYTVKGSCYVFYSSNPVKDKYTTHTLESTFDNEKLEYTVKWEAYGKYTSDTRTAEETISVLKQSRPDRPNFVSIGKINATMECGHDPWRESVKGGCRLKYSGHDQALKSLALDALYPSGNSAPASSLLDATQRAALSEKYRRAQALHKPLKPGGEKPEMEKSGVGRAVASASDAPRTANAYPNAPTIVSPKGLIFKGRGIFRITPSRYLDGTHALVQLKWLNPPPNMQGERLDFYQYEVRMAEIASPNGMAAPEIYLAPGTWEMRVRINQPKPSDWSQPVRFEYRHDLATRTAPNTRGQAEGRAQSAAPAPGPAQSTPANPPSQYLDKGPPASGGSGTQFMRP